MKPYNYKSCQSLFGYAAAVHVRSGGCCQLCGCGGDPVNFDLWRQMTVEHLIGRSQGGYLNQIREAVEQRFPGLLLASREMLVKRLDEANTVTACSFCNSTTSRDIHSKSMVGLILDSEGDPDQVYTLIFSELESILERKKADVQWKLKSVKAAFEKEVLGAIEGAANEALQSARSKGARVALYKDCDQAIDLSTSINTNNLEATAAIWNSDS